MSLQTPNAAQPRPAPPRIWLPWLILGLGFAGIALFWLWPSETFEQVYRVIGTYVLAFLTLLLLVVWMVLFSPFDWRIRWLTLAFVVGAVGACIATLKLEELRFSGDLWPIVPFRFSLSVDDLVEKHRQSEHEPLPPIASDLSGNQPDDYPEYRGRKRDGIVLGPGLNRDWATHPPRQVWRQPVGEGYAAFAVAGNLAVTLEQRRDNEAIVGYDTATGRERWLHSYAARFHEQMGGKGPRSTPTIADGEVYALGATGKLHCLDARTGRPKWVVDTLKDNANVKWGLSGSPLIVDDLVVVNPGVQSSSAPGGTLMAYERATGKLRWHAGRSSAGYSSPMLVTLAGRRQIVLFDGEGIAGYDPDPAVKDKQLWRLDWTTQESINVAQPLMLDDDRVFVTSGYGVGGAMLRIKNSEGKWSVETIWKNLTLRSKFASPVTHENHLYGLDDGVLVCIDATTGKRKWRGERFGHGQLLLSDGMLIVLSERGQLALVEATPEAYRELGQFPALGAKTSTWNLPALAGGRIYVRNAREMACYDLLARP
jgi:outer membrane protein assembly factor BamB